MEEEFTRSLYYKIFYSAIPVSFTLFLLFLYLNDPSKAGPAFFFAPLAFFISSILVIVNQFVSKVIISADRIKRVTVFGAKELLTSNVEGYRIGQKAIIVEPVADSFSKIFISNYSDFNSAEDLTKWIRENFEDLDKSDLAASEAILANNQVLGSTDIERVKTKAMIKDIAISYNVIGFVLFFAMIFIKNSVVLALLGFIYPLLTFIVIALSRGLTKFVTNSKRSTAYFTMLGFILPAFALMLSALFSYDLTAYTNLWFPFIGTSLLIFIVLYITGVNTEAPPITGQIVIMLIAAFLYGYGATVQLNCTFDGSPAKLVHTFVDNKFKQYSKGQHYYLILHPWRVGQSPEKTEVSQLRYNRCNTGSTIDVYLKEGLLNIPWYYLTKLK